MKHATNCKFCKKPITLEIDDSYYSLKDPLGIIQMACCNRCADLRIKRRSLEDKIQKTVFPLIVKGNKATDEERMLCRQILIELTKKYTALIAEWLNASTPWWDQSIVDSIMEMPNLWNSFIVQCWKMYR